MLLREPSFLSRRVYITLLLAIFTVFLCSWRFPNAKSFSIQPDPSSGGIYDLYLEDHEDITLPEHHNSSPKSNPTEVTQADQGYNSYLLLTKSCTE